MGQGGKIYKLSQSFVDICLIEMLLKKKVSQAR
jgi:hypothetical protein